MAFVLYLHRFCMSYAQRYIREDLGLSHDDFGFCFSAFFLAYALSQVPSGWLSDRYGARMMLTIYILVWSLVTVSMGAAVGFVSILFVRLFLGIGQAGAYPTACGVIKRWMPLQSRGTASGIVAWGGRLGGGLAPVLTTTLIVFFVPISERAPIEDYEVLDADRLVLPLGYALRGERPEEIPAARLEALKLFGEQLSQADRRFAWREARHWPPGYEDTAPVLKGGDPITTPGIPADSPSVNALVESLNRFIRTERLEPDSPYRNLPLEREARKLLAREDRNQFENQRLNRLVVEALFPDAFRSLYVEGWRYVMVAFGLIGVAVGAVYWYVQRERPADHPRCNQAERELIEGTDPDRSLLAEESRDDQPTDKAQLEPPPIVDILRSRSLWLMCINQWGANVGWVFLVTWLPRYLLEEHSVPLIERGWMAAIPLWVGWVGMLLGGPATDAAVRRFGLRWGRILPLIVGRFGCVVAYLSCLLHPSPWTMVAIFGVVSFCQDSTSASSWAYKQDVGGRHIGSVHGWANMWGNLGATVSPLLLNTVVKHFDWDAAFLVCAGAYVISGLAVIGVDSTIPIVREAEVPSPPRGKG